MLLLKARNWEVVKLAQDTITNNFVGKVAGSTVENPHSSQRNTLGSDTTLKSPYDYGEAGQAGQPAYDAVEVLGDGLLYIATSTVNGAIMQEVFSFDLIALVERHYDKSIPGGSVANKVAWLKTNVNQFTCNWYGFGSSANPGNQASIKVWIANTSAWGSGGLTHTNAAVTGLTFIILPGYVADRIDENGIVHFVAFAEASDGTTASQINTDYVEIQVTVTSLEGLQGATPIMNNFVGKVAGSIVENPHKVSAANWSSLIPVTSATGWTETATSGYTNRAQLDGIASNTNFTSNGYIAQELFSFDLIALVERQYSKSIPGGSIADKVAWIKNNVASIGCNWWGYGGGSAGNKVVLVYWDNGTWQTGNNFHTQSIISKLTYTLTITSNTTRIDSNGFAYFMVYANTSDGTTATSVHTDYVEIQVTVTPLVDWQTPKTDWSPTPGVMYTDINRMEINTAALKRASTIDLVDTGGYFTTKNVSAALTQLKHQLLGV